MTNLQKRISSGLVLLILLAFIISSVSLIPDVAIYVLVLLTLFFGIYPEPLLSTVDISISNLIENYEIDIKFHLAQAKN